ncbi:hypothetical protein LTR53_002720 [Teratosphaeriaceae sp. CCFEE 6253]|nr:hypothetical protein LTR53_002720 [Teratosphaeriaceae sp. CCFEE 6253]
MNVVTDGALTLIPTLLVLRLKTTSSAKLAVAALLCLSSLAMIAAIVRTKEIDRLFTFDWDHSHNIVPLYISSSLELNIIIISASIPAVAPIFKHIKHGTLLSTSTDSSRRRSDDSEIQHNLAKALGMHLPTLGNTTVITAGPLARDSQEQILIPMSTFPAIKTTTKTEVRVDRVDRR